VPPDIKSITTVMISHDTDWIAVIQNVSFEAVLSLLCVLSYLRFLMQSDSILPEPQELYNRIVALNASVIHEDGL